MERMLTLALFTESGARKRALQLLLESSQTSLLVCESGAHALCDHPMLPGCQVVILGTETLDDRLVTYFRENLVLCKPGLRVVLDGFCDPTRIAHLLRQLHVRGVIDSLADTPSDLMQSLQRIGKKQNDFGSLIKRHPDKSAEIQEHCNALIDFDPRHFLLLRQLCMGASIGEIADSLNVHRNTVTRQINRLCQKVAAGNRAELIAKTYHQVR